MKAKWHVCVPDCTEGEGQQEVTDPFGVLIGGSRGSLGWGGKIRKWALNKLSCGCLWNTLMDYIKKVGASPAVRNRRDIGQKQSIWELAIQK